MFRNVVFLYQYIIAIDLGTGSEQNTPKQSAKRSSARLSGKVPIDLSAHEKAEKVKQACDRHSSMKNKGHKSAEGCQHDASGPRNRQRLAVAFCEIQA